MCLCVCLSECMPVCETVREKVTVAQRGNGPTESERDRMREGERGQSACNWVSVREYTTDMLCMILQASSVTTTWPMKQ